MKIKMLAKSIKSFRTGNENKQQKIINEYERIFGVD